MRRRRGSVNRSCRFCLILEAESFEHELVRRIALAWLLGGLVSSFAATASSQDATGGAASTAASTPAGFGDTTNGLFTVENAFGFSESSLTETIDGKSGTVSFDDKGFLPGLLGPRLGLFGASDHVTYGAVFSAWWAKPVGQGSDTGNSIFALTLGPRIGYAGSVPKQPILGYWVRTGPTLMYLHSEKGSGTASSTSNAGYFDWAIEAYGVIHPVDHFGILVGPAFDIALFGKDSGNDEKLGVISLAVGLVADW